MAYSLLLLLSHMRSERFEISALKRRLEAMQPAGGGSATSSSFAVRQRHPWRSSEVVGEEARWRRSEQPRLRRPTIGAGGGGGGGIRGDGETVEQLRSKLAKQEAELAANTARQSRRSKRLRWLLWPLKCGTMRLRVRTTSESLSCSW